MTTPTAATPSSRRASLRAERGRGLGTVEAVVTAVLLGGLLVVLAFYIVRWVMLPALGYALNDDAVSHIATAGLAMDLHSISEHRFLPIFTMANPGDRFVDDLPTADIITTDGRVFYTSFPPGGFVLGYLAELVLGFNVSSIRLLGVVLYLVVSLFIYLVCNRTLKVRGWGRLWSVLIALLYLASPIGLQSAVFGYWGHAIAQVGFAAALWALAPGWRYRNWVRTAVLGVAAFVSCYSEWMPFLIFPALALLILFGRRDIPRRFATVGVMAIGVLAALGLMLVQWAGVTTVGDLLSHLAVREQARQGDSYFTDLKLTLKVLLYAGAPLIALFFLAVAFGKGRLQARLRQSEPRVPGFLWYRVTLAILFALSLIENLVLVAHSDEYVYDTNKTILMLCLLLGTVAPPPRRGVLALIAAVITVVGVVSATRVQAKVDVAEVQPVVKNEALWNRVGALARPDEVVATNWCPVRGTEVLAARRNMVECQSVAAVAGLVAKDDKVLYVIWDAKHPKYERYAGGKLVQSGAI